MLQQRLELLSYSGIAQKAAFYLLMQQRQTGSAVIPIPDSVSKWAMSMKLQELFYHGAAVAVNDDGAILDLHRTDSFVIIQASVNR